MSVGFERSGLSLHLAQIVFRQFFQCASLAREVCGTSREKTMLSRLFALSLVHLTGGTGYQFIVADEGLVCFVGNATRQSRQIRNANEAVAALDMSIEKGQRLSRINALDPQGCLA